MVEIIDPSHFMIWIFPLIAVLISAWLFAEYFKQRGPNIQIAFEDASESKRTRRAFDFVA